MKNEISFQQLRTPAAALASTAIVLSLLDARASTTLTRSGSC